MTTNEKAQITILISYTHEDQAYADVFMKEFRKHSHLSKDFKWVTWTDKNIPPGSLWHKDIQHQVEGCNFAVLLVSAAFLDSQYIKKDAFNDFLKQAREERFLFFPVLLNPCDYSSREELTKRQFFMPKGVDYGKPWIKTLSYADLVEFEKDTSVAIPDPSRKRFMTALVKAVEQALKDHKPKSKRKQPKHKYFKLIKPAKLLVHEDIMGPGKRTDINRDFYWRRRPDNLLEEHLKNGQSVLILGNSLAGKTRALFEALKKTDNTTILIPKETLPTPAEIEKEFALPETTDKRFIAVFDDIDWILRKNPLENLENLLLHLMEKNVLIAATCRRGNEYLGFVSLVNPQIRENLERVYINRMTDNQVNSFKEFLSKKTQNKGKLDEKAFDGNIGSYFLDLTVMYDRYVKLEKLVKTYEHLFVPENLPREILNALKYFYYTENSEGPCLFSVEKIKDFCERSLLGKRPRLKSKEKFRKQEQKNENDWQQQLNQFASPKFKEAFQPDEWKDALIVLSNPDYELNFIRTDGPYIHVEDVYLERIVENRMPITRIIGILQGVYKGEVLQRHGFLASVFAFNKLIGFAKSAEEAYRVFQKLKTLDIKPDIVTFTPLINKAETLKEALTFLDKMKEHHLKPNEVIFNSLINKAETFKDSLTFLDKMKDHHIEPDEVTFNSLLNKTETFKDALFFLEKMKEHSAKPGEVTFNSLVNKVETFDDAVNCLDKMKENDLKADVVTFTAMINKAGTFKEALTFLEKMAEHQVRPNIFTFNTLVGKTETFKDVIDLLKRMREQGLQPDKIAVNLMIKRLKQNPRQALVSLAESCTLEEIFKDHLLNRFISEACNADATCLEFIIPHADLIGQQKDSIILFYARMLEYNGAGPTALKVLENVRTPTFDSYNIKANCLRTTDFYQALELYKKALETTTDKDAGQKAIVLNNMAQLIFDHKRTDMYSAGAAYCKAALKQRPYRQFPYPGELLLLFTIHESFLENLNEQVENILKTYDIPKQILSTLVEKIKDPEKKEKIQK